MPRAPSSDVGPAPFPPLAASCTSHPWDFAQFKVCCFPQTDSPRGQGNWGSFAVGQEASRAGRGRGWGWTPESLSLGQLIGFPLYQEEQEPCTPTPTPPPPSGAAHLSTSSTPHPAPGSTASRKGRGREPSHSEANVSSSLSHCHGNCSSFT